MLETISAMPDGPDANLTQVSGDGARVHVWAEADMTMESFWRTSYERSREELHAHWKEALERERAAYERGREAEASLVKLRAETDAYIAKIESARRMPVEYWRGPVGEGFIYVVAFTTGTVKVGQTEDPRVRLNNHQSEALAFGVGTTNYYVSQPHWNFRENETALIKMCRAVGRRSRREYYHEIGYDRAMEFVDSLSFHSAGNEDRGVVASWS
ncbi:hypothetical protein [Paractinoplanes toevensis]|uniref:GIY-YIG nuclease family protein n=1 Tax=Paractinoplanes toevensis TaxID=571911 RepID=A0A919T6M4_9ACTN|nr:hypothetical protein [Actinoplanes toevensis]GIM88724.1 hypothetical protein Ato02nite_005170 [Actinoplanes toevensis]